MGSSQGFSYGQEALTVSLCRQGLLLGSVGFTEASSGCTYYSKLEVSQGLDMAALNDLLASGHAQDSFLHVSLLLMIALLQL